MKYTYEEHMGLQSLKCWQGCGWGFRSCGCGAVWLGQWFTLL